MTNKFLIHFLLLLTLFPKQSFSIEESEIFTNHKNYIGLGDKANPTKLEFGLKYQVYEDEKLFFAYHQKTLWDINNGSSPVLDSNYNPQLYQSFGEHWGWFWNLGIIEHLSNGQTGDRSRGVNLSYLQMTRTFILNHGEVDIGFKFFVSYRKDNGSPDITDYEGIWRGFIRVKNFLSFYPLYHAVDFRVAPGGSWGTDFSNGNIELNLYAQPHRKAKFTIFGQVFSGRNEYLLDMRKYHQTYRLGVAANF